MHFLLDSNVLIAIIKQNHRIMERVRQHHRASIQTSSIAMHELMWGAFKSERVAHNLEMIGALPYEVIDFTSRDAFITGEIRADLQRKGTPIGPYDVLIAGQALSRDLTLVTRNIREFSRVDGLRVENWGG